MSPQRNAKFQRDDFILPTLQVHVNERLGPQVNTDKGSHDEVDEFL